MSTINPLSKNYNCSSRFTLASESFDITNYNNVTNSTLSADTPKGVLGGMVAVMNSGTDWQSAVGLSVTFASVPTGRPTANKVTSTYPALGLFAGNSEGAAFENAPAAASGIVPIYMGKGLLFEVYVFETHTVASVSQIATYAIGLPLYCSPYGFLTCEAPTTQDNTATYTAGTGNDVILGHVTKVPTSSDLSLGVYWL